jgi:glycerate dehydrogenase
MKIAFLDTKTLGSDIDLSIFDELGDVKKYETTNENQTIDRLQNIDIAVTNKVIIDKHIINHTNLKLIQVTATGMNNIDLDYAKEKNIIVKNVAKYSTNSVAQITFSMIFKILSKIDYFDDYGKNQWINSDIFTHIVPFYELANKNFGIIGLGTIGKKVASIAKSFGANVYYYSTSKSNFNTNYTHLQLNELLSKCDIISIHAPLNNNTFNLINKNNLAYIKQDAILLNLGRGGIVNESDISNAIDAKKIYYATDVVTTEPIKQTNPLLHIKQKDRLILTPHIAWASYESRQTLINTVYNNLKNFMLSFTY